MKIQLIILACAIAVASANFFSKDYKCLIKDVLGVDSKLKVHPDYSRDMKLGSVSEGKVVKFTCPRGYQINRNTKVLETKCYSYGWYPVRPCVKIDYCKRISGLAQNVLYSPRKLAYKIKSTITFFCPKDYYRLEGSETAVCNEYGEWYYEQPPKCIKITCPERMAPDNGFVNPDPARGAVPGDKIKFSCQRGFVLEGPGEDECLRSGLWKFGRIKQRCRRICPARPAPKNGSVSPKKPFYFVEDEITFRCQKFYELVGVAVHKCTSTGRWSVRDIPTCELIKCPKRNAPVNGGIDQDSDSLIPGGMVKFFCNKGFDLIGNPKDTCKLGGSWEVNDDPTCKIRKCPGRKAPEFGSVSTTSPVAPGQGVEFSCIKGYKLVGSSKDVCLLGGNWKSGDDPTCEIIPCRRRPAPEDGSVTIRGRNGDVLDEDDLILPGSKLSFDCNRGFEFVGRTPFDKCELGGIWKVNLKPLCKKKTVYCDVYDFEYGSIHPSLPKGQHRYEAGSHVTFKCNPGYELKGPSKNFCDYNGLWKIYELSYCIPGY